MAETRIQAALLCIPIVDHHCHNLAPKPLIDCFTEGQGSAIAHAPTALAVRRAVKDVAELLECPATLSSVEEKRQAMGLEAVAQRCFAHANIAALLLDDGLLAPDLVPTLSHEKYVPCVRRVLRIERVAEEILTGAPPHGSSWDLPDFEEAFMSRLNAEDSAVPIVAFKSVCCYRSGLEVHPDPCREAAAEGLLATQEKLPRRVVHKGLVDFLVVKALQVAIKKGLPLQLHTGFGDKDLDLRKANPLHLRALLEHPNFQQCRLVLLHASYPFCREAGYLASVYPQVFLDIGLAIPHLSVQGMREAVRQCLHLCPTSKLLFSTDAHFAPETFYAAAKWGRRVLAMELSLAVDDGDLTEAEAITVAESILHCNARAIYPSLPPVTAPQSSTQPLLSSCLVPTGVEFVHLMFCDCVGLRRSRTVPAARYPQLGEIGVALAMVVLGLSLYADHTAPGNGYGPSGEVRLVPDNTTLRVCPWSPKHAMVLVNMKHESGGPWDCCPRNALAKALHLAEEKYGLTFLAGFENEFILLHPSTPTSDPVPVDQTPYCTSHAWHHSAAVLESIAHGLAALGLTVEQIHPESAPGQFEVATQCQSPMAAVDSLMFIRETITAVADKHGLKATFVPKFFAMQAGNGCHMHMSLWRNGKSVMDAGAEGEEPGAHGMSATAEAFIAGILHHLPALLALTAPSCNSHRRLQPECWSSAFQVWGLNNREAAIRVIPSVDGKQISNFEYRAFDATTNPYVAVAAIIYAGLWGIDEKMTLPEPVQQDPAVVEGLTRLPNGTLECIERLQSDAHSVLREQLGMGLVNLITATSTQDWNFFSGMTVEEEAKILCEKL